MNYADLLSGPKVIVKARVRSLADWEKYLSSDTMIAAENDDVEVDETFIGKDPDPPT